MCYYPNIVLPCRIVAFYELLFVLKVVKPADLFAGNIVKHDIF